MPCVLHTRKCSPTCTRKAWLAILFVSGYQSIIPITSGKTRKKGSQGWAEAHVLCAVYPGFDGDVFDGLAVNQETKEALVISSISAWSKLILV